MDEINYECIILIKADLNNDIRKKFLNDIIQLIHTILGKNKKIIKETLSLAYEIQDCKKADVLAFEFQIKSKAKYLINSMKKELNTHKEILSYKIIPKEERTEKNNYDIYLVYEFDYGDIDKQIKPNITIFGGYQTKSDAKTKALELLEEGKENYFIENELRDLENPFDSCNEVHLYFDRNIQKKSIYYIKIEKIKIL